MDVITSLLLWVMYCIIATIIHESGHYVTACAVGLKPDLFKLGVGNNIIFKRGSLEITALPASGMVFFNNNRLANAPQKTQKLIALGGPLSNLIAGLVTLPVIPVFALLNLLTAIANLIPFKKTDGSYVFAGVNYLQVPAGLVLIVTAIIIGIELVPLVI